MAKQPFKIDIGLSISSNVYISNNDIHVGNSTVNSFSNSVGYYLNTSDKVMSINTTSMVLGNTTVNTVVNTNGLYVNGVLFAGGASLNANDTANATFYIPFSANSTGTWTNAVITTTKLYFNPSDGQLSATIFSSLSDKNKKENIKIIDNALTKLKKLKGVTFTWKENNRKSAGLLAQDLIKILPESVDKKNMTVNYAGVIGLLIECIKELDDKLEKINNGK